MLQKTKGVGGSRRFCHVAPIQNQGRILCTQNLAGCGWRWGSRAAAALRAHRADPQHGRTPRRHRLAANGIRPARKGTPDWASLIARPHKDAPLLAAAERLMIRRSDCRSWNDGSPKRDGGFRGCRGSRLSCRCIEGVGRPVALPQGKCYRARSLPRMKCYSGQYSSRQLHTLQKRVGAWRRQAV